MDDGGLFPDEPNIDPAFTFKLPKFAGPDITPKDEKRLGRLLDRVRDLMANGAWRTLREIADACGGSEASVSARLRDFRKAQNGSLTVERRRVTDGMWEYRVSDQEPISE